MPTNYPGVGATFPATVPIIADGEALSEKNLASGLRKLADQNAYLKRIWPAAYTYGTDSGAPFWLYGNSAGVERTISAGGKVDVPNCAVGDKIVVSCCLTYTRSGNLSDAFDAWLDAIDDATGTPTSAAHLTGSHWSASNGVPSVTLGFAPLSLSGVWTVTKAGTTRLSFAFSSASMTGGDIFQVEDAFNITAVIYPVP